ncbi:MAG TPA: DUF2950 domain-containing protein [Vicinamibacterales bacterium]|nr:DUF2950 domain-containing protein [Vicinamibacterales bacterium]
MLAVAVVTGSAACRRGAEQSGGQTFATPEEAVQSLAAAVKAGKVEGVVAVFGPEGQDLIDSSDPATARRNQQVFTVAMREGWRLDENGLDSRTLVVGREDWPFPVPLVKDGNGWRFDTAAGKEEVLARRIGRNELAAIRICRTYVAAQLLYSRRGHDGKPAGLFAQAFRSDADRENGLYWPPAPGRRRSPLGDLVAQASAEGRPLGTGATGPSPFHGYYFRILTAQGAAAAGGARDYIVRGDMSGGFALVAWPAQYDATGVMTFIVNQEGVVREKDLGPETDASARSMTRYDPDPSWTAVP